MVLAECFQLRVELVDPIFVGLRGELGHFLCELNKRSTQRNTTLSHQRTLLRCVSSNRFSAAVFRSLLTTAGEARLLPAGEAVRLSSSLMTASSSFNRCVSVSSSLLLPLLLDFFFLGHHEYHDDSGCGRTYFFTMPPSATPPFNLREPPGRKSYSDIAPQSWR